MYEYFLHSLCMYKHIQIRLNSKSNNIERTILFKDLKFYMIFRYRFENHFVRPSKLYNNYVGSWKVMSNAEKKSGILAISLNCQQNYFRYIKIIFRSISKKILDFSARLFFSCNNHDKVILAYIDIFVQKFPS